MIEKQHLMDRILYLLVMAKDKVIPEKLLGR